MTKPTLNSNGRWWLNRAGVALMLIGMFGITVGMFAPYRFQIGPLSVSMRGLRNPILGLLAGYVLWRKTYDGFGRWLRDRTEWIAGPAIDGASRSFAQLLGLWRNWDWRPRAMFVLIVCQALLLLRFWSTYPTLLNYQRDAQANTVRFASFGPPGHELSLLEHFCQEVCEQTPPNARILFHGHTPAMRFAYEVFPRRVFILPQEMTAMAESWHVQPQLRDLPADPHEPYWHQFMPHDSADPTAFIRQHAIDYVATFDEYDLSRCRVEPAP
jgi:hypothetical protein